MSDRELKIVREFIDRIITNEKEREELKDTLSLLWDCEIVKGRVSQYWSDRMNHLEPQDLKVYKIDVEC